MFRARRLICTLLVTLAWTDLAFADPKSLTLSDALAAAVAHNPTLRAAHVDLAIADARVEAAAGLDDFVLDASITGQVIRTAIVSGEPVQTPTADQLSFEVDLTRPLSTGGSLSLRALSNLGTTDFVTDVGNGVTVESSSTNNSPALLLVFTQPILRGRGYDVSRALQRQARFGRDAAQATREATASATVRDVVIAYWELAYARAELGVRKQLAQAARDQLAIVAENIRVGKLPPSASAEVEVAGGVRDEDVLVAEEQVLERSLFLTQLMGLEIEPDAEYTATDSLEATGEVPVARAALDRALAQNPQLAAARDQGKVAAVDVDVTDNGLLPQLDVTLAGGPTGSAPNFGDALGQAARFEAYTVSASLVFHEAIQRRAAHGNLAVARETLHKAHITVDDLTAQVRLAVIRAVALAREARRRLDVIAPTTKSAELDLAAERARFEVGRADNFDVLRRQDELAVTQLRQLRAKTDFLQAMALLDAATGDLLARHGVTLQETER